MELEFGKMRCLDGGRSWLEVMLGCSGEWMMLMGNRTLVAGIRRTLYTLYLLLKGRFLRIVAVTIALMLLYCPAGIVSLSHGNNSTISCTSQVLVN